jgi:fluoroacetyl-CoA thioesterase
MALEPGLCARVKTKVTPDMTARAQGSGDVDGLATPAMLGLMEAAAVKAVQGQISPELTTVAKRTEVTHIAPTPVGLEIEARATLLEIEGRLLIFFVKAEDPSGPIGAGTHQRVIVRRDSFNERMEQKLAPPTDDS